MNVHEEQKNKQDVEQPQGEDHIQEELSQESAQESTASPESITVEEEAGPGSDSAAEVEMEADPSSSEVEMWRRQAEEHQQRLLRVQADYDNFRRRTRQEKEELFKYAASDLLNQLLPVLDNFDRALAAAQGGSDYDALLKGIDMIFRQFQQVLEQTGLTPMDAVGQPFNPEFHEAVMKVEDEEHEEGIVLEELQKGYMFKDKVLRPAMVKVSG